MRYALGALLGLAVAACQAPGARDVAEDTPQTTPAAAPAACAQNPSPTPVKQADPNKKDAQPAFAQQTRAPEHKTCVTLDVTRVVEGLSDPWGMAQLPDGRLLVTERTGKLWLITEAGAKSEVTGVPETDVRGQGGLLDLSLAPDFARTREVWFCYAEPRGDRTNGTTLAKARLSDDGGKLDGVTVAWRQTPPWASVLHYGCNIEWDATGNLYLTLGERSQPGPRVQSQDLKSGLGKVVRLKRDGTPAAGNPFIGRSDALPEIWSYGHRNVQGAAIHPTTGKLWTVEHGPRGGDEINVPEAGKNYGWPVITYSVEYPGGPVGEGITAKAGMEQPVYYWDPIIAPGDMTFYRGSLFPWTGDLLVSGLASNAIVRLKLDGERVVGEERFDPGIGRIRDIEEAPDGSLWVISDEAQGVLARVRPKG
jgi:aldose sugar dehydrogenase